MALVSVIIPCYNYARYLPGCVSSVLEQQGIDLSVLIIDDCSTDDSAEVGQALADGEQRIEFRRHEPNRGHIATYNEGFEWASGEYTVLLSADDLLVPGALGRAAALLDARPNVGFVYGRTIFLTDEGRPQTPRTEDGGTTVWSGAEWLEKRCKDASNSISSPEVVIRTSMLKMLGGFRPELPHSGDLEFWMRCAVHGEVGYIRKAYQAYYRVHPNSMLRQNFAAPMIDLHERRKAFDVLFDEQGDFVADRERLQEMAHKAMARDALWRACRAYDRGRTDSVPVDEMVAFALDVYPKATSLREYTGLRWRRRVGAKLCPFLQPILLAPVLRRLRREWSWRSTQRNGI